MKIEIQPSSIAGTIYIPASKSAMQRACAAALIRVGETELFNPGVSDDDKAALNIIQQLGAEVERKESTVAIKSKGLNSLSGVLDCGESGLSTRMFTMIASCLPNQVTIKGHGSLEKRPLDFSILRQSGVEVISNNGFLPIQIKGPLQPHNLTIDGSLSSQYLTGLLFAYSAMGASDVTIEVVNLASRPYIDLTLEIMKEFGLKVPVNKDYREFHFGKDDFPSQQGKINYRVEGDWSSASFPLVAAAINGAITIKGLKINSAQSDKSILDVLKIAGAQVRVNAEEIEIKSAPLKGFEFDATDCPDLFPPLAALACFSSGESRVRGAGRLTYKESNRAQTLESEFRKLGADISFSGDTMTVKGKELNGASVSSHGDHRIAMAIAVAAIKSKGPTIIEGSESVNKSYPQFWMQMEGVGMRQIANP